jgi:DNA ligase 1
MDALAAFCEQIASHSSRNRKVELLAAHLRKLGDADLRRAVHFLCCGPLYEAHNETLFGPAEPRRLSIGGATLRQAMAAASGWDSETVRLCATEVGDSGETASLLMAGRSAGEPMTLSTAQDLYSALAAAPSTIEKVALLKNIFTTYRPLAIKYWVKAISGNFRIGLQAKMLEEAVAAAAGADIEDVRAANNRLGDLARVALAARNAELHTIEAALFHPMEFMLAKPIEFIADLAAPEAYFVEDKFDGIRSQLHFENVRVALFTRGMEDVTHAFPEVEAAARSLSGSGVLDGEIVAWREGRALSFSVLQQRLARKRISAQLVADIPVVFVAYDVLFRDGAMLVECPIEERRAALEAMLAEAAFPLLASPLHTGDLDRLFEQARARGNEGLILKRRGSLYEAGKRSGSWRKLKRVFATLDVVITAAEQGHGRRATVLSDYTFAVRAGDGFANIGKAYSGLTDSEVRELTKILRAAATEKFGRVVLVKPAIVLEVAFDGIQKSPRHKSGFALRFPRIVRWRKDKPAGECDDIARVRELYESALNLTAAPDA